LDNTVGNLVLIII